MAQKVSDCFPENVFLFNISSTFGAQIVWLFPWNRSPGTLAGQGEQTARMPRGFLIAHVHHSDFGGVFKERILGN